MGWDRAVRFGGKEEGVFSGEQGFGLWCKMVARGFDQIRIVGSGRQEKDIAILSLLVS